jgi:hypothetical protein
VKKEISWSSTGSITVLNMILQPARICMHSHAMYDRLCAIIGSLDQEAHTLSAQTNEEEYKKDGKKVAYKY